MKYPERSLVIHDRKKVNDKILHVIRSGLEVDAGMVFHSYTGKGGLHGLNAKDYSNYTKFSAAKKPLELGQFFTPNALCQTLADILGIEEHELVLDPSCGKGSFFNVIEFEERLYGVDIDADAVTVASYCFPHATLTQGDLSTFVPPHRMDVVIGNPPFNFRLEHDDKPMNSQDVFVRRANGWLKTGGLLAFVAPDTFLSDAFQDKATIAFINKHFRFVAQCALPDYFDIDLDTKLMIFQKDWGGMEALFQGRDAVLSKPEERRPFDQRYQAFDIQHLKNLVAQARRDAFANRRSVTATNIAEDKIANEQRAALTKLLFDLQRHPRLQDQYLKARKLLHELKYQRKPDHLSVDEWEKHKLRFPTVVKEIKLMLSRQHEVPRDEIRLVKGKFGFHYKGYSEHTRPEASQLPRFDLHDLVRTGLIPDELAGFTRMLTRRIRLFTRHQQDLMEFVPNEVQVSRLEAETFYKTGDTHGPLFAQLAPFHLSTLQANDAARIATRNYAYLAWEPGTGKTAVSFMWAKDKRTPYTFIVSTDLSIRGTWQDFMRRQDVAFQLLDSPKDVTNLRPGVILLTFNRMKSVHRSLKRVMKRISGQTTLVVDEADELVNRETQRTQMTLALFRRCKNKLLATGTATRNSIQEMYPQIELLYNNSTTMMCHAQHIWLEDKATGGLNLHANPYHLRPFPPGREGYKIFCAAFSPKRVTVFGMLKDTQDVYNGAALEQLLRTFRITRTFEEVVGKDRYSFHQHIVPMTAHEAQLQAKLIEAFYEFETYFQSTGNSRKDAGLRAVRQLTLLKDMTSFGHLFKEYTGTQVSSKMMAAKDILASHQGLAMIGLLRKRVFGRNYLAEWGKLLEGLGRPIFYVDGDLNAKARMEVARKFQDTKDGILISTQTSLSASVNIPKCSLVIIPELQWNFPRIRQYAGRPLRYDSPNVVHLHFLLLDKSIDINLWNLIIAKERLNNVIKHGTTTSTEDLCQMLGLDPNLLDIVMAKELDHEGKVKINWKQKITAQAA
jgi:hypothetical protein